MTTTELSSHVLVRTLEQLSAATSLSEVTSVVTTAVRSLTGADGATFVLREDDQCFYADEDAIGPLWRGQRFPMSACVSGWAMVHKQTVLIEDVYADDRVPHDAYRPTFVTSLCLTPVRPIAPLGAIGAYWKDPHTPQASQVRQLEVLATSVAVAIENLELRGAVTRRQDERDELETAIHTLAHDLRNPLVAMMGYAELLVDDIEADPELARALAQTIVVSGQRLSSQIDRMLSLYRLTSRPLAPVPTDLSAIAREVAAQHLIVGSDRSVRIEVEDGLEALADPVLAQLALDHLIDNAVKFTARRHEALIEIARVDGPSAFTTLVVRDNGEGFDADQAHRLFRPLSRLHPQADFPGTGLGLASVARIVEQHGGQVRADGRPGFGASFFVSFPAVSQ